MAARPAPVPTAVGERDRVTHDRLLEEARKLFAARGYHGVTVREICAAAQANVAAINYHFGGKSGLYREILSTAIQLMRQTTLQARREGEGGTAEQRLRVFIRVFLHRVGETPDSWIRQLMAHEMANPTEALDDVVREVLAPRIAYMAELVAELLGTTSDDERVLRCVLSVQSQFQVAVANPVARRLVPGLTHDSAALDRLAQHIADFSIGGIRAMRDADSPGSAGTRRTSSATRSTSAATGRTSPAAGRRSSAARRR